MHENVGKMDYECERLYILAQTFNKQTIWILNKN